MKKTLNLLTANRTAFLVIGFIAKRFGLPSAFLGIAGCCLVVAVVANRIMRK